MAWVRGLIGEAARHGEGPPWREIQETQAYEVLRVLE